MANNKSTKQRKKTTITKKENKNTNKDKDNLINSRIKDEIYSIIIIAVGIFFTIAMQTDAAGEFGLIIKKIFMGQFGKIAYLMPYYIIIYGILLLMKKVSNLSKKSILLLTLIFFMISTIYSCEFIEVEKISMTYIDFVKWFGKGISGDGGGAVGMFLALIVMVAVGKTGLYIFSSVVIIICMIMLLNTSIFQMIENYKIRQIAKKEIYEEKKKSREIEEKENELNKSQLKEEYKEKFRNNNISQENENVRNKKKNIISIMTDDTIYGVENNNNNNEKKEELEIKTEIKELVEVDEKKNEIKYGLEEKEEVKEGYGLLDDENINIINSNKENKIKTEENNKLFIEKKIEEETEHKSIEEDEIIKELEEYIARPEPDGNLDEEVKQDNKEDNIILNQEKITSYKFPPIDLLKKNKVSDKKDDKDHLYEKASKLEQTLKDFKVNAKVIDVAKGPAVTRYEIQPSTGVKVNSIVRLADDIALNLEAKSIRIEAPIPGKAAVGIEVENENVNMVTVREIIESKEFKEAKSKITFAVGRDISGKSVVADLKTMPHMLIAGSTGSGKSVCINSIITSILYKASPEEVKLVLIDPKVVELGNYNGIPHMLIPVVTEPSKAAAALNWAVAEMTDRYKKFAENGVKDLEGYNKYITENKKEEELMPQIVIVIDELADLMMAAPSQVEEAICRLAQMARAAGMHLIVATQRPSVDVITGVIKANIPSRIAFAVSSQFDSRTILDMSGAEKLVGKGDMLFNPIGAGKPTRVQGTFISEKEVNQVIQHLKEQNLAENDTKDILKSIEKIDLKSSKDDNEDELINEAIECVVSSKQASVSMIQRRFRVGYNRAARIIESMEKKGVIGPQDGSRPRQVIWTDTELENTSLDKIEDEDV